MAAASGLQEHLVPCILGANFEIREWIRHTNGTGAMFPLVQ